MKKRLIISMISILTFATFFTACGKKEAPVAEPVEEVKEEVVEEKSGIDKENFSIKDMYNENEFSKVFDRHEAIQIKCKNTQGDKEISDSLFQYYYGDDKKLKMEAKVDNSGAETQYEGLEGESYYMFYEPKSMSSAAVIIKPDDFMASMQQLGGINSYETYEYTDTEIKEVEDTLEISANIENAGKVTYIVDSQNGDLKSAKYTYESGVTTEYTYVYDDFEKNIGAKVLDDNIDSGMCYKLTVTYINGDDKKDVDYNIAAGTEFVLSGVEYYDLFTDEECSDDSWVKELTMSEEDMHVYAKYVEQ